MSGSDTPFELPDLWRWMRLEDLADVNPTFSDNGLTEDEEVSFVPMRRVEELTGGIDVSETRPLDEVRTGYTYFENGDVLFAKITPCMENGKAAIARDLHNGVGFGSTEFHVIRHPEKVTQEWIFHYLIQEGFRRDAKRAMTGSAGQKRVPTRYIKNIHIPVPPLPEQRRIVDKIEELFSNLDAGVASLKTARRQVDRYRQSVLQAAVEGRLTADWRQSHAPEPAEELLARILEERRVQWEKQYHWERYGSKGKDAPSGWKSRYKEPVRLQDKDELGQLPKGWKRISLHHMCRWSNGDGLTQKEREDGPYPVYGGNGVTGSHSEYMIETHAIVVGRVGAHCGNVHIAPSESWVTDNAIYSKWISDLVNERFLLVQLRTKRLNQLAGGSGQPYISQKVLKSLPIALPPLAEQKQIVAEVERLLSVADDTAATIDRELQRAERLRQSILKQAFSGKLVAHTEDVPQASGYGEVSAGTQVELGL